MNTDLATPYDLVLEQEQWFKRSLTGNAVTWEKESMFAIQHLQIKDKHGNDSLLLRTARTNIVSLQNAIINVSAIGISLNPANRHAYLVPRGGMVCLDISYMGLMHLAIQDGGIMWGQAKLVYKNDAYRNEGVDKAPTHTQDTFGDRGLIVGAYCTVKLPSGDFLTEEMGIDALTKVKNTSKSANGPWKTFPEEMMRKTVVKRGSKYWPSCERLNRAVSVINEHEGLSDEHLNTAPDIDKFTENQKLYFDGLIEDNKAVEMYLLNIGIGDPLFAALYHSFKDGTKGKYQKIIDSLIRNGADIITADAASLTDAVGDDIKSAEIIEGMSKPALRHILDKCLIGEVEIYIRGMIANRSTGDS